MLQNYLRVALRHLRKNKVATAINVGGLALGLACAFFILGFVQDERSYDHFHENADRIYRLVADQYTAADTAYVAITSAPMGPALAAEFPAVQRAVRLYPTSALFERGSRRFQEEQVFYADSTLFDVFTFPLLSGDSKIALREPYSVVLTEATARKYFGEEDALGQTLLLDGEQPYTVTGVMAPIPHNSHLQFEALLSHTSWESEEDNWFWFGWHTYLLLPPAYDAAVLKRELPGFMERHVGERMREIGFSFALSLQPLKRVYLNAGREGAMGPVGSATNLYIFSAIALFTLLMAGVNFVNLSIARAASRAKEVGIRKVSGSTRAQLAGQFLSESVVLSLLALAMAAVLVLVFREPYTAISGKTLDLYGGALVSHGAFLLWLALGVGLLAGIYPALVLSSFRPVVVLRGHYQTSARGAGLRKALVVVQFAITFGLLVGTGVVYTQLDYLKGKSLGVDAEQLLVLDFRSDESVRQRYESVQTEFVRIPGVEAASFSSVVPGVNPWNLTTSVEGVEGALRESNLDMYFVDHDFFRTFGVTAVAGRGFSRDFPSDAVNGYVVNTAAVQHFGWGTPEEALGKRMVRGEAEGQVIGVVEDFHVESFHQTVGPLALQVRPTAYRFLTLRVGTAELPRTLEAVEDTWARVVPSRPLERFFLDDRFAEQYRAEERFGRVFGVFAALALVIACLGLFGLSAFTAQQRTKEIGVRKVMGATVTMIVALLSKDFAKLVLTAFVVAAPVAYFLMGNWLEGFAYHIMLGPGVFLLAGVGALFIALLTVSYHALRAATADPVKSLRSE